MTVAMAIYNAEAEAIVIINIQPYQEKSRIRETLNLSACADNSTDAKRNPKKIMCQVMHCTALHCTALHCTTLRCTALHCTVMLWF